MRGQKGARVVATVAKHSPVDAKPRHPFVAIGMVRGDVIAAIDSVAKHSPDGAFDAGGIIEKVAEPSGVSSVDHI